MSLFIILWRQVTKSSLYLKDGELSSSTPPEKTHTHMVPKERSSNNLPYLITFGDRIFESMQISYFS